MRYEGNAFAAGTDGFARFSLCSGRRTNRWITFIWAPCRAGDTKGHALPLPARLPSPHPLGGRGYWFLPWLKTASSGNKEGFLEECSRAGAAFPAKPAEHSEAQLGGPLSLPGSAKKQTLIIFGGASGEGDARHPHKPRARIIISRSLFPELSGNGDYSSSFIRHDSLLESSPRHP